MLAVAAAPALAQPPPDRGTAPPTRTAAPGRPATRGTSRCGRASTSSWRRPEAKAGEVDPESVAVTPATGGGRGRRAPPAGPPLRRGGLGLAPAEAGPLGREVARRLHRARQAAEARDALHGARRRGRAADGGRDLELHHRGGRRRSTPLEFPLDLRAEPVRWHGRFFSGLCNVIFCSQAANYGPTYDLMAEARKRHPRAWSYQRDFWPTGTEFRPAGLPPAAAPQHRPRARDAADRRDRAARGRRRAPRRGRLRPRAVRHPRRPARGATTTTRATRC